MITLAINNEFGVMAVDSGAYSASQNKRLFDNGRIYFSPGKYVVGYIGNPSYFAQIDKSKFQLDMAGLSIYLEGYLKGMKSLVQKSLKSELATGEEKADVCLIVMGIHRKLPTIAQFNSYRNFKPKYNFSSNKEVKFPSIPYDDEKKFLPVIEFMEKKLKKNKEEVTPGVIGEILSRAIYKFDDTEKEKPFYKKEIGGVVNVGCIFSSGVIFSLSGMQVL